MVDEIGRAKIQLAQEAVQAGQLKTQLGPAELQAKSSLLPYGTAGTTNALNTLNFFASGATPPASTAGLTQPNTLGSDISRFGAGLTSAGLDLWRPTVAKKPPAAQPVVDMYGQPIG